ncbi:hypothetical protein FEM03_05360 [Phragmitibacter flavus]|uniref:Uncharacterized protein n=1 Tax=Phragmitibacter flavus TaxID=2576071 RepID=A0A5R8KGY8_9BACT|nr:Amuc_1100 family pilus-like protein [Phragmitibacter flavus]TLD71573.1 hypothetical protein FEM03_05360 [Phragmitibacter flavus]
MNWIKENKSLAAVFGVMIVGAIALGAWLFMSYSGYTAKREEWETTTAKIKALESQKLYPDAANAAEKEQRVTEYAEQVNLLRSALLNPAVQQAIKPLSETEFQARLKERVNAVRGSATGNMTLPEDFALGFEEYTGSLPRSADVAAELGLHLDVMEKLVTALVDSGVQSLDGFERAPLPNEKAAPAPKPEPAAPARRNSASRRGGKKALISEETAAEPVLDRYTVKVFLTADQAPFQAVLNSLSDPAKMPHFVVVRLLRVENEQTESPLKETIRSQARSGSTGGDGGVNADGTTASAAAATPSASGAARVIVPPTPLPPDAVTVMGAEMLKVYLEIDYIRFRPAAVEAAAEEQATTAAVAL